MQTASDHAARTMDYVGDVANNYIKCYFVMSPVGIDIDRLVTVLLKLLESICILCTQNPSLTQRDRWLIDWCLQAQWIYRSHNMVDRSRRSIIRTQQIKYISKSNRHDYHICGKSVFSLTKAKLTFKQICVSQINVI